MKNHNDEKSFSKSSVAYFSFKFTLISLNIVCANPSFVYNVCAGLADFPAVAGLLLILITPEGVYLEVSPFFVIR